MRKLMVALFVAGTMGSVNTASAVGQPALAPQPLAIGGKLPVESLPGTELAKPGAVAWTKFPAQRVDLTLAPPVHQSINLRYDAATPAVPVDVQAASDGQRLYVRMRWEDNSKNVETSREAFADGAAVQFALAGGEGTSFMMGAPSGPVNIWYWKASAAEAANLAAGGFGSTSTLDGAGLDVETAHSDGHWTVVFSREIAGSGDHQVELSALAGHIGFAVWQGEGRQRDGLKHVTMGWLVMGEAP